MRILPRAKVLPNGTKDEVRVSGGKAEKIKRLEQEILDGSENWTTWSGTIPKPDTLTFKASQQFPLTMPIGSNIAPLCDAFPSFNSPNDLNNTNGEGVANHTTMYLRINKSRLATEDVAGLKAWLQENPITLIYQLAIPKHYLSRFIY